MGKPTGPVSTFRDLVVHVPVSCGSACCASTRDDATTATPRVSDGRMESPVLSSVWFIDMMESFK